MLSCKVNVTLLTLSIVIIYQEDDKLTGDRVVLVIMGHGNSWIEDDSDGTEMMRAISNVAMAADRRLDVDIGWTRGL